MSQWQDAMRRELARYQRRTGEAVVTSEELFQQSSHRLEEQFPNAETPRRTIAKVLGELIESGEIERIDEGEFRILSVKLDDVAVSALDTAERELLEQWEQTLQEAVSGHHFRLREHNFKSEARARAQTFIDDPSEENFKQLWGVLHSASQRGSPQQIYAKWRDTGGSDEELATLIEEILEAETYDPDWEPELGAKRTLRELFGVFNIESQPILNNSTETGLRIFGYPRPGNYADGKRYFNDFKVDYEATVGHVREDVAPLNLEIDQLFNVLDKVSEEDIEQANTDAEAELYRLALQMDAGDDNGGTGGNGIEEVSKVPGQTWQMSPGYQEFGLWPAMRDADVIAMGYGSGDLSEQTEEEILDDVEQGGSMAASFGKDIETGDVIVAKKGYSKEIYGIGVVTRSSYYDPERAEELFPEHANHNNFVDVDWIIEFDEGDTYRAELPDLERDFYGPTLSKFSSSRYENLIAAVEATFPEKVDKFETVKRRSMEPVEEPRRHFQGGSPELNQLSELIERVDFYWVNQREPDETSEESRQEPFSGYLQSPIDENPTHDLDSLDEDDIVFHYYESQLIGYSQVETTAQVIEIKNNQLYRVEVDSTPFEESIPRDEFGRLLARNAEGFDALPMFLNGYQGYLYDLPDSAAEMLIDCLYRRFDIDQPTTDNAERLADRLALPNVAPSLPDGLYFEDAESLRREITASLNSDKNIIFTGPPGTGKSELAEHICRERRNRNQIDDFIFSTATAEWTAYDTIGGYMPRKNREDGTLEFNPGQFLRCFRTEDGTVVNRWLIIDEINRADIDKAFGQLFSVLSEDSVDLPYERDAPIRIEWIDDSDQVADIASNPDTYPVTPAWRLIGTMNTADKTSLYEMSFAFMRRFNFIHVGIPELETEHDEVRASLLQPVDTEDSDEENYATAWRKSIVEPESFLDTLDAIHASVAVVWANLTEHRPIGPAIIFDIVSYVEEYVDTPTDDEELANGVTRAIISLVYPQLEGMRPDKQTTLIKDLSSSRPVDTETEPTHLPDEQLLKRKAEDMFAISFKDDDES